ncbi:cation diffusion facilitator family transporter [Myxococcota bacterium]|nr:cation diffusion facilitator family transporter [Myxococcota bacterium]
MTRKPDTDHGHTHGLHHAGANKRRLIIALALAASYMAIEIVGGVMTGSLALLADAGHMASDVLSLCLSLFALQIAQRPATPSRTYGYRRTEILAALLQGVLLIAISAVIAINATERFRAPQEVLGGPMLLVALGGLVINVVGLMILNEGRRENLNIRGAWLHVLSDALGSVGAIAAGFAIWAWQLQWADAAASILIAGLIVTASIALIRETVDVLMEAAPRHIDVEAVRASIAEFNGVASVHDLHVWTITSGMVSLSGHVVASNESLTDSLLQDICDRLHTRFGIAHSTIQIEYENFREPGEVCSN